MASLGVGVLIFHYGVVLDFVLAFEDGFLVFLVFEVGLFFDGGATFLELGGASLVVGLGLVLLVFVVVFFLFFEDLSFDF